MKMDEEKTQVCIEVIGILVVEYTEGHVSYSPPYKPYNTPPCNPPYDLLYGV